MRYLSFIFLFLTYSISSAQTAPSIQWQKSLGGPDNENLSSIQQLVDGGYIMAGVSTSIGGDVTGNHGNNDCWVVRLDNNGNILWQKSLGGSGNDAGISLHQTVNGELLIASSSNSTDGDVTGNHGGNDYWVVKLDANGNILWQKSLGGSGNDIPRSIYPTSDGGSIVAGSSTSTDGDVTGNHGNSDYWIVKLDIDGNIQWQKSLGGSGSEFANSIQQIYDGGYIIAGTSTSTDGDVTENHGNSDYWVVRLNYDGTLLWQKSIGTSGHDTAYSVQQTYEAGFVVAGVSPSGGEGSLPDYWIVKLNNNGILQWDKHLGGTGYDIAYTIRQTTNWDLIVGGWSASTNGDVTGQHGQQDYWIARLDYYGNLKWQKCLGGSDIDSFNSLDLTEDGGLIAVGSSRSIDGDVTGNHGLMDAWVVKLGPETLGISENSLLQKPNLYPNPAKDFFYLDHLPKETTIDITDMSGRKFFSQKYHEEKIRINTSAFPHGIYIVQVKNKEEIILSEKIIINR